MTSIDTLLARTSPLTEYEAIVLASECKMLLERAKLCAEAARDNTRVKVREMRELPDSIQSALDDMPSIENWEEAHAISQAIGE